MFTLELTNLTKEASSVERIKEYIENKELEASLDGPSKLKQDWVTEGKIEGKDVQVKYRKKLDFVLKGLDFVIEPKKKTAIVGRTGSGKSTMLLCLSRVLELLGDEGEKTGVIEIDGVDISKIGLHSLRKNLVIIPQDPLLLEGTLRFNIDPFNEYSNEVVKKSLERVNFWSTIETKKKDEQAAHEVGRPGIDMKLLSEHKDLNFKIESRGENLSIGQRQLICIARALIRNPKILLMDEATSNIDQKTDSLIQSIIMGLKDCTVVTIAHRISTIINYDKIMVLDQGKLIEFGAPKELFDKGGIFHGLVLESGQNL